MQPMLTGVLSASFLHPQSSAEEEWSKGYFAFPPSPNQQSENTLPGPLFPANEPQAGTVNASRHAKQTAWEERCRREAQAREGRLARERAEALAGEMDWVRAGFSLRDELGQIDVQRTEELRREIQLQDEERRKMEKWDAYETRWKELLGSEGSVQFADIPWPVLSPPSSVLDLSHGAIDEFIFATLDVRTNTITRRERTRTSLLRWHPDKLSAIMARVESEDEQAVRDGINAVFRCLKALQDTDKQT